MPQSLAFIIFVLQTPHGKFLQSIIGCRGLNWTYRMFSICCTCTTTTVLNSLVLNAFSLKSTENRRRNPSHRPKKKKCKSSTKHFQVFNRKKCKPFIKKFRFIDLKMQTIDLKMQHMYLKMHVIYKKMQVIYLKMQTIDQ